MTNTSNNDEIERIELSDLLGSDSNINDDEVPNWDRHQTTVDSMVTSEGEGYAFLKNGQRQK